MPPARHRAGGATATHYMLDMDTCSSITKRSHPLVLKRLQAVPVTDVCMSVTEGELLYSVEVSRWPRSCPTSRPSTSRTARRSTTAAGGGL